MSKEEYLEFAKGLAALNINTVADPALPDSAIELAVANVHKMLDRLAKWDD